MRRYAQFRVYRPCDEGTECQVTGRCRLLVRGTSRRALTLAVVGTTLAIVTGSARAADFPVACGDVSTTTGLAFAINQANGNGNGTTVDTVTLGLGCTY